MSVKDHAWTHNIRAFIIQAHQQYYCRVSDSTQLGLLAFLAYNSKHKSYKIAAHYSYRNS